MKRFTRAAVAAAVTLATVGGGIALTESTASAAASCAGAGYLCFYDYGTSQYGSVAGNNTSWGAFGWNDRADWFRNDGTSCNVRIFENNDYLGSGFTLARGDAVSWSNIVSSNKWCV